MLSLSLNPPVLGGAALGGGTTVGTEGSIGALELAPELAGGALVAPVLVPPALVPNRSFKTGAGVVVAAAAESCD